MKIAGTIPIRDVEENYINIQPIQAAGRLTAEAMKALIAYGDGYSTCDQCRKPFRLDKITKPPIAEFHNELAAFLHMDEARVTPGARRAFQAVCLALVEKGDAVLVSALGHYTEFLAVENAKATVREVPVNDRNIVTRDAVAQKIEDVRLESGKSPALLMLDHFDYSLANEHDVAGAAKVAHQYDVPILYNGAYTVGIKPVDGKALGVDFVVGSGHKSMASPAPSGVLATTREYVDSVFSTTQMIGDVTGRQFGIKEVQMLGCTLMGGNMLAMMASFPTVKRRVEEWQQHVAKSNYVVDALLDIKGNACVSEYPRKHTLSKVDTTGSFDTVARTHKRRGFFLSDELKQRGIVGAFSGATRAWKLNTYGLSWDQIRYVADAFKEIAGKYALL
ncbi:MAG TPA: O-phospho-L-seryl-tRNA:Cys-tRNA synthase [Candidatus Bathyarchaeia archaeon]|nr:O-phospho-L-seryl-tRNA:Cys-tRNA synthase [Candidatus Bathyarchaeia archaeon]